LLLFARRIPEFAHGGDGGGAAMLAGKWTYRSYRNQTGLIGDDAAAALADIFGEGIFDLKVSGDDVTGALGMGTGYALTLTGRQEPPAYGRPAQFSLVGKGLDGTATAGWHYDYQGILCPSWPEAIDQIPCLVGTVVRVTAHGPNSPAGVTASFIAVRHSDNPPPRTGRGFALLAG
jgi:hypothetical protein